MKNSLIDSDQGIEASLARPTGGNLAAPAAKAGEALFAAVLPWLRRRPARARPAEFGHFRRLIANGGQRRRVRSDDDVLCACLEALSWHQGVPEGAICLEVRHGNVVLTGTVGLPHECAAAEMAIRDIEGVASISNLVTLKSAPIGADMAAAIRVAVSRDVPGRDEPIEVRVDGACVLLSGRVRSRRERDAALAAAWGAPGVAAVIDEMVVHSS